MSDTSRLDEHGKFRDLAPTPKVLRLRPRIDCFPPLRETPKFLRRSYAAAVATGRIGSCRISGRSLLDAWLDGLEGTSMGIQSKSVRPDMEAEVDDAAIRNSDAGT